MDTGRLWPCPRPAELWEAQGGPVTLSVGYLLSAVRVGLASRMLKARQERGLQELEAATPLPWPLERPAIRLALPLQQKIIHQSVVSQPHGGLPREPSQSE